MAQRFTAVTIPTPLDKANKRYSVPTCSGGHTGDTDTVVQGPSLSRSVMRSIFVQVVGVRGLSSTPSGFIPGGRIVGC